MAEFKHKKSLGQNFLKDYNVLEKIATAIKLNNNDLVIEIGPGQGALTQKLQDQEVQLLCYEIDERTKPYLEKLKNTKTTILYQNILKSNLKDDIATYNFNKCIFSRITGSINYYNLFFHVIIPLK